MIVEVHHADNQELLAVCGEQVCAVVDQVVHARLLLVTLRRDRDDRERENKQDLRYGHSRLFRLVLLLRHSARARVCVCGDAVLSVDRESICLLSCFMDDIAMTADIFLHYAAESCGSVRSSRCLDNDSISSIVSSYGIRLVSLAGLPF